ncbi:M16 family metallopeptidase [Micromonospora sp. GCM10011542]|uniref:M16 family metallopeptidase n=1 Tax=Micromonospora sp. GCM10011542 TaxID=3317337 RepID=UPI00361C4228
MIRQLDVDGVPTLLAPTSGPLRAGLVFRVGVADETLPRRGITHLLEHLVLAPLGPLEHHLNGTTETLFTSFVVQGAPADVATFLNGVCANLVDPPTGRLEMEKEILRVERSSRGDRALDTLPLWRHGARDHGLPGYPEFGLTSISDEDVRQWAAQWFTRQNAVLFVAGDEVPAGLRLPLPEGARQPVPAASSVLPTTPAYFSYGAGAVALDAVVRRGPAASVLAGVLERELYRSLRQDDGLSYQVTAGYEPRHDGFATLRALADSLPDKQDAVLGGFVDALATLRVGRIAPADRDAVVARHHDGLALAEADNGRLLRSARDLLTGEPLRQRDELRDELAAVTVEDLHDVAREMCASALLLVPAGLRADWAGFSAAPATSEEALTGVRHLSLQGEAELVVGTDGLSLVHEEQQVTVRYAECAALLVWPDGARRLIGPDAISVHVEPHLFERPPDVAAIDAAVPEDRHVPMPARDPELIPPPPPVLGRFARLRRSVREATSEAGAFLSVLIFDPGR